MYRPQPDDKFNAYQAEGNLPAQNNPCVCTKNRSQSINATDTAGFARVFDGKWRFEKVEII